MAEQSLPDYYFDLGAKPEASQEEIDRVYARRVAELRASKVEDAPEELAEVEAAYAVLKDPAQRASYDAKLREEEEAEEKASPSGPRPARNRRSGSWIDVILDIFGFLK
jgi:curved DNA-binding protein CbpA